MRLSRRIKRPRELYLEREDGVNETILDEK